MANNDNNINIDDSTLDLLNSSSESIQFNNPDALNIYQTLYHDKDSILSCSTINDRIFVGCQSGAIQVWDNKTLLKLGSLLGHTSAVLCLTLSKDGQKLYSGSSDDTVRVWCTRSLQPLYIIHTRTNVGDILSIVSSPADNTIYIGCQNTSIQKFNLEEYLQIQSPHIKKKLVPNPRLKGQTADSEGFDVADYFFNQCNIKGSTKSKLKDKIKGGEIQLEENMQLDKVDPENSKIIPEFVIPAEWIYPHCHYGYIYSLTIGSIPEDPENEYLFSGSGDGDIKIWKICPQTKHLIHFSTLQNEKINNIYSLVIREDYLICGSQGGNILVFDLDTFSKFRTLIGHKDDVLSLCLHRDELFSASADGAIKRWNANLDVIENKLAHDGMILALAVNDQGLLLSGGSDHMLKLWWVQPTRPNSVSLSYIASEDIDCIGQNNNNGFIKLLNKFVSIPTISGNPKFQQDCMRGARFLKNLFLTLGAESKLVHGAESRNPLVLAKFKANKKKAGFSSAFNTPKTPSQSSKLNTSSDSSKSNLDSKVPHVLFYGHYDVIPVDESQWNYHPFKVTGANGYLYGRGVTDNKGPILATIFAIAELYQAKELDVDITLVIEGEEESGSIGFYEAVKKHKNWIGNPDVVLLSNSYWIGEDIPCVTYGLRGKINASIQVSNTRPDAHSGFYGGVIGEPLIDLTRVISKLVTEDHKVNIPGFYDNVRPVSAREDSYYTNLASVIDSNQSEAIKSKLQSQWRFPTLTLHRIVSSGPSDHSSVISSFCKADISMRIVPDQKLEDITQQFIDHVTSLFDELKSDNKVNVEIHQTANWWIANPDNEYYDLLTDCITKEWGKSPLLIREGGSIPTVPWLEDFFNCPAIHFPMGQSSDQAHLKNERIRLRNLQAGKSIIRNFFIQLSAKKNSQQSSGELDRDKVFEPQSSSEQANGSRKTSLVVLNNSLLNIESESDGDSLNQFKISDIEDI